MKIGLDIMGGDFAPKAIVLGAIEAQKALSSDQNLVLIGDQDQAQKIIQEAGGNLEDFEYVHTTEFISMGEHPTKAITHKPNASICLGFQLLKEGKIDSFASAGNTGAMFVGSMLSVKSIEGISRPAIASNIPKEKSGYGILLDVGANADCKAETLVQFAVLGSLFAEHIYNVTNPKVGLINLGEEEEKGNNLTHAAYPLFKEKEGINFIGNIEGRDLFNDKADVMVCDGFVGNIMLKLAESFHNLVEERNFKDDFF